MADENEEELKLENPKKKIIIIIAIVIILIAVGVGAYIFLGESDEDVSQAEVNAELNSGDGETSDTNSVSGETEAEKGSALYVPLPRAFRFNVPGAERDRFVEIRVQLLVRGIGNEETTKKHIPLLESTLTGVFSQENAENLARSAGKAALKQRALEAVQAAMKDISGESTVEKVLFTGFVMQ